MTIISILEDLATKLPPVRRNIELVRLQFAARFKHEDLMMQQITPPGFNAAEKVHLLTLKLTYLKNGTSNQALEMPAVGNERNPFEMLVLPVISVSLTGTAGNKEPKIGHIYCTLRLIFV